MANAFYAFEKYAHFFYCQPYSLVIYILFEYEETSTHIWYRTWVSGNNSPIIFNVVR